MLTNEPHCKVLPIYYYQCWKHLFTFFISRFFDEYKVQKNNIYLK